MRIMITTLLGLLSATVQAGTICVGTCPGGSPPAGGLPPELTELTLEGSGFLQIDFAGTLYLDSAVYQSHLADFTQFASDTAILFDPLPADYPFPSYSEITTVQLAGISYADFGVASDAIIRDLNFSGEIRFHAAGDILVTDTAALLAVPVPAAFALFLSGLAALGRVARRKSGRAFQSRGPVAGSVRRCRLTRPPCFP